MSNIGSQKRLRRFQRKWTLENIKKPMIKTIEIAPDIVAKELAKYLAAKVDDFTGVSNLYHEATIDEDALWLILREYFNE